MKEALAYEKAGDYQSAIDAYAEIIEKFSTSSVYNDAQKNKARVEVIQGEKK
jgi:tetratricopeptide (TPR) repeat protein